MATYPAGIYSPRTKENKSGVEYDADKTTVLFAEDIVYDDNEIVAIETELGTNPKGAKADVAERLDDVDSAIAGKEDALGFTPLDSAGDTLLGALNLGENAGLELDSALSADGKYSGIVESGVAGATLVFGDLCFFQAADSRWEKVDANLSAGYDKKLGMCVLAAADDSSATNILLIGKIRADSKFPTLTIGSPVYMAESAGDVVVAQPSTADVCIRVVGYGVTADVLFFNPSGDYIVHS